MPLGSQKQAPHPLPLTHSYSPPPPAATGSVYTPTLSLLSRARPNTEHVLLLTSKPDHFCHIPLRAKADLRNIRAQRVYVCVYAVCVHCVCACVCSVCLHNACVHNMCAWYICVCAYSACVWCVWCVCVCVCVCVSVCVCVCVCVCGVGPVVGNRPSRQIFLKIHFRPTCIRIFGNTY